MTEQKKRVFLFNAYGWYGGSYMLYQIGRICHEVFKTPVFVVQTYKGKRGEGRFHYPYDFPTISIQQMLDRVTSQDIFFCNPVHSARDFGSQLTCQKVMYLQGVNTYTLVDPHFDHYVSNSQFVQQHVKDHFRIDSQVIHPFINGDIFNKGIPWNNRSNQILLLSYKKETMQEYKQLMRRYQREHRWGAFAFNKVRNVSQEQLAQIMGQHKYYLTLTPVEGFGLPPLEAMSSGCAVFGFDGYGGRDYFTDNNSRVAEYQNYASVIEWLYKISQNPNIGRKFSENAIETAKQFTFEHYKQAWTKFLQDSIFKN